MASNLFAQPAHARPSCAPHEEHEQADLSSLPTGASEEAALPSYEKHLDNLVNGADQAGPANGPPKKEKTWKKPSFKKPPMTPEEMKPFVNREIRMLRPCKKGTWNTGDTFVVKNGFETRWTTRSGPVVSKNLEGIQWEWASPSENVHQVDPCFGRQILMLTDDKWWKKHDKLTIDRITPTCLKVQCRGPGTGKEITISRNAEGRRWRWTDNDMNKEDRGDVGSPIGQDVDCVGGQDVPAHINLGSKRKREETTLAERRLGGKDKQSPMVIGPSYSRQVCLLRDKKGWVTGDILTVALEDESHLLLHRPNFGKRIKTPRSQEGVAWEWAEVESRLQEDVSLEAPIGRNGSSCDDDALAHLQPPLKRNRDGETGTGKSDGGAGSIG